MKGFLGRFLRRKLMETEISGRVRNAELVKIIDWIPKVWHHLNRFLEAHSSSDVTIGKWAVGGRGGGGGGRHCSWSSGRLRRVSWEPWPGQRLAGTGQLGATLYARMRRGRRDDHSPGHTPQRLPVACVRCCVSFPLFAQRTRAHQQQREASSPG